MKRQAFHQLTKAVSVVVFGAAGVSMIPSCGGDLEQFESANVGESAEPLVTTLQAELLEPGGGANKRFSHGMDLDGETAVLSGANGVHVFTRSGSLWSVQQKLVANNLGSAVAIKGDTIVVGAPGDGDKGSNAGAAYVFTRNGTTWTQQAKLVPDDALPNDYVGTTVDIDGDTVVVGMGYGGYSTPTCSQNGNGGAYVFVRNGTTWTQQAKLTKILPNYYPCERDFGAVVAVSGDTAVVGSQTDLYFGVIVVFARNGTTWTEQATLPTDGCTARVGDSVAISGDTLVAGAYLYSDGAACIYTRSGGTWSFQTQIVNPTQGAQSATGFSSGLSLSGNKLLIGAYWESVGSPWNSFTQEGAAYLYEGSGATWTLVTQITPNFREQKSLFGTRVALSGSTSMVAAPYDDVGSNADQGVVYVFTSQMPLTNLGGACTTNTDCGSGFCADGVCCDNPCDNTCMACTAAKKGKGLDGYCGSIAYDTDPDAECWGGACNGQNACQYYNGMACTAASECLSKYCVDGFCCNNICMGGCSACSTDKKGSGYNGVCGLISAGTNPDGECTDGGSCNGSGACTTAQSKMPNGSACSSATQCQSGYCADGVCCDNWCLGTCKACTAAKKGGGVDGTCGFIADQTDPENECANGSCSGQGTCKLAAGAYCSSASQCQSGHCVDNVCCDAVCNGWCLACSAAKKGQGADGVCEGIANGRDPDGECNPGECNGSGACNVSQNLLPDGNACISAGQCASGSCVDGYCCDTACSGSCQACSASKKGSGSNGTCGPIAYDTDPDDECWGGSCDGAGICKYYNGVPCSTTTECLSNYCVDGFCCGNVCTLQCMACSAAKKGSGYDGVCGMIASGTDPDDECANGSCSGSGMCQSP